MADQQRIQLPPSIKPGSKQAKQFHQDLINSLQQKMLDYHVQNPGLAQGQDVHAGQFVRPVHPDIARQNYAASLVGQPHSALAYLGFGGDEPITPEVAQAVAASHPAPYEHAFAPDEAYNAMQAHYALAKLAPIASETAYNNAGGPAVNQYLQVTKKPDLGAYEKFKERASDPTPILRAAKKLRDTEQGFGINTQQPSAYKAALTEYLGPPPSGAPTMTGPAVPPSQTPVAPPPANYGRV